MKHYKRSNSKVVGVKIPKRPVISQAALRIEERK